MSDNKITVKEFTNLLKCDNPNSINIIDYIDNEISSQSVFLPSLESNPIKKANTEGYIEALQLLKENISSSYVRLTT